MTLLVVILNYKVTALTIECLKSLAPEISQIPGAQVVVVENGSGEGAEVRLRDAIGAHGWGNWVEIDSLPHNLGYTAGNNFAIRKYMASTDPPDHILLLNADTVVKTGAITALLNFMDELPQAGIAGSHLEYPDGRPQGSPFRFQGVASELDRGLRIGIISRLLARWAGNLSKSSLPCAVDWVAGASMLVRRQVIESVGPLDEGFFAYFEDMDYCFNARRAGWSTWYVPQSRIIHYEGCSSHIGSEIRERRPRYWFQARRRFFLKNYGALHAAAADFAFIAGSLLDQVRRVVQRTPNPNPPHLLLDSFLNSVFVTGFKLENRNQCNGDAKL